MKNRTWLIVLIAAVIVSSVGGYRSGDYRLTTVISSGVDTDGSFTTVTLSEASPDCTFANRDATSTNTLDITLNGGSNKIRLYGGDTYNTASSDIPIWVTSFVSDAVVNTPDVQWFCYGR